MQKEKVVEPLYVAGLNSIESFLVKHSIPIKHVKQLPPNDRNTFMRERLFSKREIAEAIAYRNFRDVDLQDSRVGLILVKPEMFPRIHTIESFLSRLRIKFSTQQTVLPTKQQWLNTYGYLLEEHPNIVNVYIAQSALGVKPILFEHLSIKEYLKISGVESDERDVDKLFDALFCGDINDGKNTTLRGGVVLPGLINLGFDDMSGYAEQFDPVNFYADSHADRRFTSYNGVHIPGDMCEKAKNLVNYVL